MTRTSAQVLAAADRVRRACSDPDPPEPREPAAQSTWAAEAAERRRILAAQEAEAERTDRALAALPRRRGPAPKR